MPRYFNSLTSDQLQILIRINQDMVQEMDLMRTRYRTKLRLHGLMNLHPGSPAGWTRPSNKPIAWCVTCDGCRPKKHRIRRRDRCWI